MRLVTRLIVLEVRSISRDVAAFDDNEDDDHPFLACLQNINNGIKPSLPSLTNLM